jgi:predicted Ser/Thr protein kinase
MPPNQKRIQLLQAEVDENDQSFFRLLVDGHRIKYLTIEPGIYEADDMCFGPALASLLPPLPSGNWNDGLVALDAKRQPHFVYTTRTAFPGVKNTWHGTRVDCLEIETGEKLRTGIYKAKIPTVAAVVVAKFARFDWEIGYMENETTAYEWIDGHDIGPRFLGHLTEDGRVTGFLMEYIADARHAGPGDLEACREVLSRLHELGIRHGDTNRFNFLVRGSEATLVDFDTARRCSDGDVLLAELASLSECLQDSSMRGGRYSA